MKMKFIPAKDVVKITEEAERDHKMIAKENTNSIYAGSAKLVNFAVLFNVTFYKKVFLFKFFVKFGSASYFIYRHFSNSLTA